MADISDLYEAAIELRTQYCLDNGDGDAAERLTLSLSGRRVLFAVMDAESCGSSISGFLQPGNWEITIKRALSRVMRQRARDRVIALSGESGTPAWSLDIHTTSYAALCHAGINPLLLASHNPLIRESSFDREVAASPIETTAEIRAGRIFLSSLTVKPDSGMDDSLVLYESEVGGGCPCVLLRNRTIPETLATAFVGHPLSDIISHPLVDDDADVIANTVTNHISTDGSHLIISLADDRMTLTPLPDGLEAEWLRFPWNP